MTPARRIAIVKAEHDKIFNAGFYAGVTAARQQDAEIAKSWKPVLGWRGWQPDEVPESIYVAIAAAELPLTFAAASSGAAAGSGGG